MFEIPPEELTPRQRLAAGVFALIVAVTRVWALSKTYWDWDEALFASAVVDFDVTRHHPHPPGFPVYIMLAKLFHFVIGSEFRALQAVNLFAAILLFPAAFFFARELRLGFRTSLLAASICAFIPTVWFFGGTAFSDVPSLTLIVWACALLLRGARSRRSYFAGTLLLALAIGVRPQNMLIGLAPGLIATWYRARDRWRDVALALLLGGAIVGAAYGGAARASGTWKDYRETVEIHRSYIVKIDSFRSAIRPPLHDVFKEFFVKMYGAGRWNYVLSLLAAFALVVAAIDRSRPVLLLLLTFGPFCFFAWLFLDHLSANRFAIGYIPLFAFLAAFALVRLGDALGRTPRVRADVATTVLGLLLVGGLIVWTAPAIGTARRSAAPTAGAMQWVRAHLDPRTARIFVTTEMLPFAEYALRGYHVTHVRDESDIPVIDWKTSRSWVVMEGVIVGRGEEFVWPKTRLSEIVRRRYFETTVFPRQNTALFGEGWYAAESDGRDDWRWMGGRSVIELAPAGPAARLELRLQVPLELLHAIPTITVTVNGAVIDRIRGDTQYIERAWTVPSRSDRLNVLVIETDRTVNPRRAGLVDDPRDLGLMLHWIRWDS